MHLVNRHRMLALFMRSAMPGDKPYQLRLISVSSYGYGWIIIHLAFVRHLRAKYEFLPAAQFFEVELLLHYHKEGMIEVK